MKKLVIIDGNSFAHRAYHAMQNIESNSRIVIGVPKMLKNVINTEKPDFFVVAFDPQDDGGYRKNLYGQYKENRDKSPEELSLQIKWLQRLCDTMGYSNICIEGYEGDDVIGTLAKKGEKANMEVVIYTGDKDMSQLISKNVTVYNTGKKQYINIDNFEDVYGVKPDKLIDYLAIEGDDIDNIPGIPLCGPKTTLSLINNIGGVEEILSNPEKIKEIIKKNKDNIYNSIIENKEQLILNKKLATIVTDLNMDLKIKDIRFKPIQEDLFNKYLNYYNLKRESIISEHAFIMQTQNFIEDKKKVLNNEKNESLIKKNKLKP